MTTARTTTLQIDRADITRTRWHESAHAPLQPGQVRLQVEQVGLTANNITYAELGDALHYWDFFPQEDPGWGCVPTWGHAVVSESRCPDVDEGQRVFGFLPFATDVVVEPTRLRGGGFVDGSAHRADLPSPYNAYTAAPAAVRQPEVEAYDALLRPLFTTSLLVADWLAAQQHHGADTVLLSSASSKTAFGIAYALTRLGTDDRPRVVGLTSAAHVESTGRLGLYDEVLAYDQLETLDPDRPTVYVDLSGSASVREAVHTHCTDLRHDCAVGLTHRETAGAAAALPGPEPVFFFAPAEFERQAAQIGPAALVGRIDESLAGFIETVSDPAAPLLTITWHHGPDAAARAYADAALGRTDPGHATMVALQSPTGTR